MINLINNRGRLFIIGVGGSAANASHAVNDFRKINRIDAIAPTDNISWVTAMTNDEGFEKIFDSFLEISRAGENDILLILSVGGGTEQTSRNLKKAIEYAKSKSITTVAIVGKMDGVAYELADYCLLVPIVNSGLITPHAEELQSVILHLISSCIDYELGMFIYKVSEEANKK
jgi:D-sedoheptulose 7-phosphate isomerase